MRSSREISQKDLGAFYTCEPVVRFLVRWGLDRSPGVVFDPACGDGRFLKVAAEYGAKKLVGCDVDPQALEHTARSLSTCASPFQLLPGDFFALSPGSISNVDLIVGNPPFIRYQRFTGRTRQRALASALRLGVRLTKLTSAWAPFLLHAIQFLRPGGTMAVVVPAEILQTQYGIPTLRGLCSRFKCVKVILFQRNFFADAQAETYLLLAHGYGGASANVKMVRLSTIDQLDRMASSLVTGESSVDLSISDPVRFALVFLASEERDAWRSVTSRREVLRISDCGVVTNGYVSGANEFFHRTLRAALQDGIPIEWLIPTVRSAKSLRGLEFTSQDVQSLEAKARAHHLLSLPDGGLFNPYSNELEALISAGKEQRVPDRFKCRVRTPWWRVPAVHIPDVFLPYMIGRSPIASVNAAKATHTNTVHGLRVEMGYNAHAVALSLLSTLSLLSMELEGRSYGGGVLKLEPSEASRIQLLVPKISSQLTGKVDDLLRSGRYDVAVQVADDLVLRKTLKLESGKITLLRAARARLVKRRYERSRRSLPGCPC